MKSALSLSIVLLTFVGSTKAEPPDAAAPQLLIQAKFVEITEQAPGLSLGAPLPAPLDMAREVPGLLGTFTDPQFQVLIRELSQRKGVDLLAAPGMTTRIGQEARIEITRELVYKDEAGMRAIKNVGLTLAVHPKKTADDQFDLVLSPQIVECDGFVNHKNGWEEPIFKERKATAGVVMTSGQTLVLELEPKTDKQSSKKRTKQAASSARRPCFTRGACWFLSPPNLLILPPASRAFPNAPQTETVTGAQEFRHGTKPVVAPLPSGVVPVRAFKYRPMSVALVTSIMIVSQMDQSQHACHWTSTTDTPAATR